MNRSSLCLGSVAAVTTAFLLVACGGDTIGDTIVLPFDGGPSLDATTPGTDASADAASDATTEDAAPSPDAGDDASATDGGQDAGQDSGQMDAGPSCTDGVKDGTETGTDCGGSCTTKCANGVACATNADCTSNACDPDALVCTMPGCTDNFQDGNETGSDCGGSCAPMETCGTGVGCTVPADCTNGVCTIAAGATTGTCAAPTCSDGVVNEGETGTDVPVTPATNTECGGANCPACPDTSGCKVGTDCADKVCTGATSTTNGTCAAASCTDGVQNGLESGNDCGGTSVCGLCGTAICTLPTQCASRICTGANPTMLPPPAGTCTTSSCSDGVQNDGEMGVDCGGPSNGVTCGACTGGACTQASDCAHSETCTNKVCTVPTSCATVPSTTNGVYTIQPGATAYSVYCDFTTAGGPWTLVAKMTGDNTWGYDSALWTNADRTDLDTTTPSITLASSKYPAFDDVAVTALRADLYITAMDVQTYTQAVTGTSTQAVFSGTAQPVSSMDANPAPGLATHPWPAVSLIQDPLFHAQTGCHYFGINAEFAPTLPNNYQTRSGIRFGFVANEDDVCGTNDTAIGLGEKNDDGTASSAALSCASGPCFLAGDGTMAGTGTGTTTAAGGLLWAKSN